jgi:hypothetical protein
MLRHDTSLIKRNFTKTAVWTLQAKSSHECHGAAGGHNPNRAARGSVVLPDREIVPKKQEI